MIYKIDLFLTLERKTRTNSRLIPRVFARGLRPSLTRSPALYPSLKHVGLTYVHQGGKEFKPWVTFGCRDHDGYRQPSISETCLIQRLGRDCAQQAKFRLLSSSPAPALKHILLSVTQCSSPLLQVLVLFVVLPWLPKPSYLPSAPAQLCIGHRLCLTSLRLRLFPICQEYSLQGYTEVLFDVLVDVYS